mgnify:CR=1 FL=1
MVKEISKKIDKPTDKKPLAFFLARQVHLRSPSVDGKTLLAGTFILGEARMTIDKKVCKRMIANRRWIPCCCEICRVKNKQECKQKPKGEK